MSYWKKNYSKNRNELNDEQGEAVPCQCLDSCPLCRRCVVPLLPCWAWVMRYRSPPVCSGPVSLGRAGTWETSCGLRGLLSLDWHSGCTASSRSRANPALLSLSHHTAHWDIREKMARALDSGMEVLKKNINPGSLHKQSLQSSRVLWTFAQGWIVSNSGMSVYSELRMQHGKILVFDGSKGCVCDAD